MKLVAKYENKGGVVLLTGPAELCLSGLFERIQEVVKHNSDAAEYAALNETISQVSHVLICLRLLYPCRCRLLLTSRWMLVLTLECV